VLSDAEIAEAARWARERAVVVRGATPATETRARGLTLVLDADAVGRRRAR